MNVMEISFNPQLKEDLKTHLSIDPPLIFKEPQKTADEPLWRPCRQCGHPFSRMNDVCPKCGKNQKEPTLKSLVKIRSKVSNERAGNEKMKMPV